MDRTSVEGIVSTTNFIVASSRETSTCQWGASDRLNDPKEFYGLLVYKKKYHFKIRTTDHVGFHITTCCFFRDGKDLQGTRKSTFDASGLLEIDGVEQQLIIGKLQWNRYMSIIYGVAPNRERKGSDTSERVRIRSSDRYSYSSADRHIRLHRKEPEYVRQSGIHILQSISDFLVKNGSFSREVSRYLSRSEWRLE
jgi:hypothetical protein